MNIYEEVKNKYKRRKIFSILVLGAGCLCFLLTILFIFAPSGFKSATWTQYHNWAIGLACLFVVIGATLLAHAFWAIANIERTVDKLNPDEREQHISEKSRARALQIYLWVIFPAIFIASSVLFLCDKINIVAWAIIITNFLAVLITYVVIRRIYNDKF